MHTYIPTYIYTCIYVLYIYVCISEYRVICWSCQNALIRSSVAFSLHPFIRVDLIQGLESSPGQSLNHDAAGTTGWISSFSMLFLGWFSPIKICQHVDFTSWEMDIYQPTWRFYQPETGFNQLKPGLKHQHICWWGLWFWVEFCIHGFVDGIPSITDDLLGWLGTGKQPTTRWVNINLAASCSYFGLNPQKGSI